MDHGIMVALSKVAVVRREAGGAARVDARGAEGGLVDNVAPDAPAARHAIRVARRLVRVRREARVLRSVREVKGRQVAPREHRPVGARRADDGVEGMRDAPGGGGASAATAAATSPRPPPTSIVTCGANWSKTLGEP